MMDGLQYDRYQEYMRRFEDDLGLTSTRSLEDASAGWTMRRLSSSEFDDLVIAMEADPALRDRWLNRLQLGYDRDRARLVDEIEEIFTQPTVDDLTSEAFEDAA